MSAAVWSAPPNQPSPRALDIVAELRVELARLGIDAGSGEGDWPVLTADRNLYGTDMVHMGRITTDAALQLIAALRAYMPRGGDDAA